MKRQVGTLDAIPSKRLFLSIIADYDLNKAICELVDNGFDVWTRIGRQRDITIKVRLDGELGTIQVEDDAGGLPENELRYIVGPGQTGSAATDQTIGIFGVGTKRAVVALAHDVRIKTRHGTGPTHQIEFDESWLQDDEWALPLFVVDEIPAGTTRVELQRLRVQLTKDSTDHLRNHLGSTYARFLVLPEVTLELDGIRIAPRFFEDWSFPPSYEPRRYTGIIQTPRDRPVQVEVLAGLSSESSPTAGEYGVYFYCNDRLVAPAMKSFDVGFTTGQAGKPHPKISLTKVIVRLQGDAQEMPWNSSKSDISTKHHVFLALHDWLVKVVADYARVSRAWMGAWSERIFPYSDGTIQNVEIGDFLLAKRSFLPDPPKSRPQRAERLAAKNAQLVKRSPWTKGLYEGIFAAEVVAKQPLDQANWFALNILDLTLTTALRTYLVNKAGGTLSARAMKTMLTRIPRASEALRSAVPLRPEDWTAIENLAKRREELTYGRSDPTIADAELKEAESLVREVLTTLHGVQTDV